MVQLASCSPCVYGLLEYAVCSKGECRDGGASWELFVAQLKPHLAVVGEWAATAASSGIGV